MASVHKDASPSVPDTTGAAPRTVVVLVHDGVQLLDVAGPVEVFTAADALGARYDVVLASPDGRDVVATGRTRLGVDVAFDALPDRIDTLVVPGSPASPDAGAADRVVRAVATTAPRSRRVASVCAGAFLLAAAGVLDGRRATTHWEMTDRLAAAHPDVTVDPDAIFVRDGAVHTSAGITAGIDLCLALVEDDHGADAARRVAQHLVVYLQRPGGQAQFSARLTAAPVADPVLRRVLDDVVERPDADHGLDALAERAGFSVRHLTRVFRRELGTTPARYVERVRVEAARQRMLAGPEPLAAIAAACGFGSEETMRRAFIRELGTTPGAWRAGFASTTRGALTPR
ncbi:MAG: DJ-1/PfpI family protein [Solirubrobacteraceae bacterium]|nr:DJ-1/PfpI family protein [Solirubrobacteraceae bacterium]